MMERLNLALFVVEAIAYFAIMVTLLHFRHRIGLGVFLTALGVMHFMETYLAAVFYVALPFGIVSPGSSVFFAGKLMMILMLYLKEDAATVRQPIYGLFLGNLMTVGIAWFLQLHIPVDLTGGRGADFGFLNEMGWLMIWGTALLYIDSLGIILLYEKLGRFIQRWVVLRFMLSGLALLTFDQVGFFAVLHYFVGVPLSVFWGGWLAKMLSVCIYSGLFAAYQFAVRRHGATLAQRSISDVFNDLTFRERYQDLLSRSGRDTLTGVLDRNSMELDGPQLVRDSLEREETMTVLLLDADNFKDVNDRFGHLEGDEVLKAVASQFATVLRPTDRLFRFGGEEFVVLCPRTNHAEGLLLAEHLRWQVAGTVRNLEGQPITVSIGVATLGPDSVSFNGLLAVADDRLYQAKKCGRNCVVGQNGKVAAA
ncbi:GGDEF domain-containing protein [Neorhizobium sp. P12A]|uniref:GGDEF domain-containing protein n=1 Tax=Neorhizobium sp. P12A TaxID=2268027 RepID=UPI00165E1592|nr:GGDEF domain-containing protein [Neorhizobium sp. P12A]